MLNEIDLSRADLNLLVLFEVVCRERHVRRAAQRLRLSSSAVSHGLRRLRGMFDDPLFLKTPAGVVPTSRATELAEPISEVLARVRHVLACVEPFDPATTARRFRIGAPDSAVVLFRVLADLRRRGFSVPRLRRLLTTLHDQFGVRLYEAIGDDGVMTLYIAGDQLYARTKDGGLYDLDTPTQPLLMVGQDLPIRPLVVRARKRRTSGSEKLSRGRRPDAE